MAGAISQGHSLYLLKVGLLSPGSLCLEAFPRLHSKSETMTDRKHVDKYCWGCCTPSPTAPWRDWKALPRVLESRPVNFFWPHTPLPQLGIPVISFHLNSLHLNPGGFKKGHREYYDPPLKILVYLEYVLFSPCLHGILQMTTVKTNSSGLKRV